MMMVDDEMTLATTAVPPPPVVQSHRVLLYTTCYNVIDGVTLTIRKIEQELLAAGHSVLILTTKSGDVNNTHMDGTHLNREVLFLDNSIPIPFLEDSNNPTVSYHLGYSLSRETRLKMDEFEPTLLHITVPDNLCLHLIQYARDKEIPLMGTYHSNIPDYMDHYPGLKWLKPLLATFFLHQYCFLQSLYVPTPYIHKHLSETYQMNQATSLEIWGRGIDLEKFSPRFYSSKFRQSTLGMNDDDHAVVICWVGRCVPEKRTDIFANVIRRLHACGIPYHALIIGRGPSEQDLKSLPNSTFVGWLVGEPLSIAYASSDLFLFPSAVETFGNVTLEAAASGLPLVVEAGCSGHLVNDGVNGFGCTDEESFFQATRKLCVDRELRESAARASRQHALQFEKRAIVQQMLQHYSHVTNEFYCDYGGRHENRDAKYLSKQAAFIAGSHPRPVALVFVEFIFITTFRVMTWLWVGFVWFSGHLLSQMVGASQERVPNHHYHRPASAAVVRPAPVKAPVVMKQSLQKQPRPLVRVNTVEMTLMEEGGHLDDEETSVTASESGSLTSTSSTESDVSTNDSTTPPSGSCFISFLDGPRMERFASNFVRAVAFQCRIESGLRTAVRNFLCRRLRVERKRKNSTILSPPPLRRDCSDAASECSSDSSRQDDTLKRRLRRSSPPLSSNGAEVSP